MTIRLPVQSIFEGRAFEIFEVPQNLIYRGRGRNFFKSQSLYICALGCGNPTKVARSNQQKHTFTRGSVNRRWSGQGQVCSWDRLQSAVSIKKFPLNYMNSRLHHYFPYYLWASFLGLKSDDITILRIITILIKYHFFITWTTSLPR